ncbi:MAG: citrate/2-methylcitrate synthase [Deltaproteobacteria bacterium]|nr:citrate/2-methylcitrate synthase [Deltaproteobacteria bacterium]
MTVTGTEFKRGLEGVIADQSSICLVDGVEGKLYYRGYSISDLVGCTFPEVTYLLLKGKLPNQKELSEITHKLREKRSIPRFIIDIIHSLPKSAHPMEVLQACVAALGTAHHDDEPLEEKIITLISQFPIICASYYRYKKGQAVVPSSQDESEGGHFLQILKDAQSDKEEARIMETCFILHMEHGFNASTFAARAIGSTLAPYHASISGAVGSLYGPLHGGANEGVLDIVKEIGSPENVSAWVKKALQEKRKITGMGHRVYKVKDPRAYILEDLLKSCAEKTGNTKNYEILKELEVTMKLEMEKRGKPIYPNVDFFSGALYNLLGIPRELFTPLFAIARVVGWSAHLVEMWQDNRLYRPKLLYQGTRDEKFIPLKNRRS